jgi:hypothetical protein
VAETLARIIERLKEAQRPSTESLGDYDVIDEATEELVPEEEQSADAPEPLIDPKKLQAEIAELEGYRALALRIGENAKGITLVKALPAGAAPQCCRRPESARFPGAGHAGV